MRIRSMLFAGLAALWGCGDSEPTTNEPATPRPEPVVVYVDQPGEAALRPMFDRLTDALGIPVTIRESDREKNLTDILSNRGAPPADILITDNIGDIWAAGDDGSLRQLGPESGVDAVPHDYFRDPDRLWFALGVNRYQVVAADGVPLPQSLEDLGDEAYAQMLCLPSSESPDALALIAGLITEHGERPAELVARKWVRNLALAPMATGKGLIDAVNAGRCPIAIVTARDIALFGPAPQHTTGASFIYSNLFAAGLARHARYPESGVEVLNWLATADSGFAEAAGIEPLAEVEPKHSASTLGWQIEEARLLAERARWR